MNFNLKCLTLSLAIAGAASAGAQPYTAAHRAHPYIAAAPLLRTTTADEDENNYDVKYVKLDLQMSNTSTFISGSATTKALVTAPSMAAYVFELNPLLTIDSLFIDGVRRPVTGSGDVRTAGMLSSLAGGALFTVQVYYHGTPESGTLFGANGMNTLSSPRWGSKVTFTLSESYKAKDWWPCKQSLQDKIDSSDIWLTVSDSLKAGSNGILTTVTPIDASHNRYEWKERIPIDYYLLSACVGPFVDYSFYMHFAGSTDSMLIQNYVYDNPATLPFFKSRIDSTALMVDYFSSLYGRYPFWQEKYGHCMAPLSGGMEHQTMTTLGFFDGWLVAHELGHQWFGDNVTCRTWADIVVNEGFAAYTEYLFLDHFYSHAAAMADIKGRQDNIRSEMGGTVYCDDTTSEPRIFDSRLTYDKGACVLHTLRSVFDNDSLYFSIYKTYQQQLGDSTGTIIDVVRMAKDAGGPVVNGIDLNTFFLQWVYEEGFPIYTASWNQIGDDVYVKLNQTTSVPTSVSHFTVPLEFTFSSMTGDTTVRVLNNDALQHFHFKWAKSMNRLELDPNNWLIDSVTSVARDAALGIRTAPLTAISIAPNPATANWFATGLPANCEVRLADMAGRILWTGANTTNAEIAIPAAALAPGIYLITIVNDGKETRTIKALKG